MKGYISSPMVVLALAVALFTAGDLAAKEVSHLEYIYNPGELKPVDSELRVSVGDMAPDFILKSLTGTKVRLSQFRGKSNVVLSFVPAAWTPVCSDQWPGYNITRKFFDENNSVLLGITVDNIPTLYAWTREMGGLWFEVLSDFWPHGEVARRYGLLRSDGVSERALIYIDLHGVIKNIEVTDINTRPSLETMVKTLRELGQGE